MNDKKRILKTGFLVSFSIFLLIWGIHFLKGKDLFKIENKFYIKYEHVDGLIVSNQVLINGFKVGQVNDIRFESDTSGILIVEILVQDQYKIPKNTIAEIYSADLMGTKSIRLIRSKQPELSLSGDTLIAAIEQDLKEQVNMQILPLKNKAENLISSMDSALTVIRYIFNDNTRHNLQRSFESIKTTIKNLERTTFTLDDLMSNEKSKLEQIFTNIESITANINNSNAEIQNIITNFSNISDSLAKSDILAIINNTEKAVDNINQVVEKINNGEGSIGMLLHNDTLYTHLENASYNLNRLIRDINENPKRYIHFSAIDLGRTVYIVDGEEKERIKKEKKDKRKAQRDERKNNK